VPLSLGIEVTTGENSIIIEKNSKIPCEFTKVFYPPYDYCTSVSIKVYEGEQKMAIDNDLLGKFWLNNITSGPKYGSPLDVTFILNNEGILTARAKERHQNNVKEIQIDVKNARLQKHEVEKMLINAMKHAEIDEAAKQKAAAKNALIDYIKKCEIAIADDLVSRPLSEMDKRKIEQKCQMETHWFYTNDVEKSVLDARLRDLKKFIDTFAWNLNKNKLI
jgi:molecular chaperone DnaK